MSLRVKVLMFMIGLIFLYGVLDYSIKRFIFIPEFLRLEKAQAADNLQRSIQAIQREVQLLDSECHNRAARDDTYRFVKGPWQEYVKSTLAVDSFKNLGINLIYFCDNQGRLVWGKMYDLNTGREMHVGDFPAEGLPRDHPLLWMRFEGKNLSDVSVSGVIVTGKGPMLIAARPILTSNDTGPVRGTLIMGKFLDKSLVDMLVAQTRVNFTILLDPAEEAALLKAPTYAVGREFPCRIEYRNPYYLDIAALYPDLRGRPAFIIRSFLRRDIMQGGRKAIQYALATLAVAGIFVAVLILFLMERTLLHPVVNLTRHVLSINETGNFSLRLRVNRRDEVGTLGREFDRMLGKIEDMNTMMEDINDKLIDDIQKKLEMERKLQAANSQLEKLASLDGLTGISNRRKFDEYLEVEWKRGIRDREPLSLIILDVDFFKAFNDTYGHQAGDECLRSIAGVISSFARRASDLAARYGGEEFAMVLPSTDLDGALHLAESIRTRIQDLPISLDRSSEERHVTLSAGVSTLVPGKASSPDELIRMADTALYEAKATGRNKSVAKKEI